MPIFPRYPVSQQDIPVLSIPVPEPDLSLAKTALGIGKLGATVAEIATGVAAKRQQLADTTALANATMQAELDLEEEFSKIKENRALHATAPDALLQAVKTKEPQWMQGLKPEQQVTLKKTLVPKLIQYQREARTLSNKYQIDEAKATLDSVENRIKDKAVRLDQPDDTAFNDLIRVEVTPATEDLPETRTLKAGPYQEYLAALVNSGLLSHDDAMKRLQSVTREAAYARIQRMTVSDNPALVQRAIDTLKSEEQNPNSTFVRYIDPKDRNQLLKEAQGHLYTLEQRDRAERERQQREYERLTKETEQKQVTEFVAKTLRNETTMDDLETLRRNNGELAKSHSLYEHLVDLVKKQADGQTDPALYAVLWERAIQGRLQPIDVVPHAGTRLTRKDAEHLLNVSSSKTVLDDDFFKAGYRDIENALRPPVGILDEARQRRFSEASREYYDRAVGLIKQGKREQLPSLAREIADRWLSVAKTVEPFAPKFAPRYPTREETLQAFQAQYGPDPRRWPPSARQEFDRQMWLHDQIAADEARRPTPAPTPQAPKKPKPPSPF
jgi:hypothetical protein